MKYSATLFLFLLFFSQFLSAQETGRGVKAGEQKISGRVVDESGAPVPYAAVGLFGSVDSTVAMGTATTPEGEFNLSAKPGNYYIRISFLSYKEKLIKDINLAGEPIDLGDITLFESAVNIGEIEIVAEKSRMELSLDKRVFNVGKDLSSTGGNAAEILENIPSISVDIDGNVSLRGSENVRILINGKPSGLTSGEDAMRRLPANMIDKVEIITNPSAKYEAEGEAGIINIILKKEQNKGVNGSFEASAGYPENLGGGFNVNFRKNNFNLFTGYNINYRKYPGSGYSYQEFNLPDSNYAFETIREHERGGLSHSFRMGTDFFLNSFNTITVSGLYKFSEEDNIAILKYNDFNGSGNIINSTTRVDNEKENEHDIEGSFNYTKTFRQKDRKLTFDSKYIESDDTEVSRIIQTENDHSPLYQNSTNTEDQKTWLFQTDYIHPLGNDSKFEAGLRSSLRDISNDFTVQEEVSPGNWETLENFDNHFIYRENIHAAYLIGATKINRLSFQGGLRSEYSDISTELVETEDDNQWKYLSLFPSAHFSYELDSFNTLQLSYSRRISRPRFRELIPFFSYSDSRNIYSGNPELQPEFTNSFEAGHLKYFKKGTLLSSFYYRYRTGVVERIVVPDTSGTTRRFPVNLSVEHAFGLEFSLNYRIFNWWNLTGNLNLYNAETKGTYEGREYRSKVFSLNSNATSKLTLAKKYDFQASFRYRAPHQTTQGRRKAMYHLDLGASTSLLKKKADLTLSIRDVFNTRKYRSEILQDDYFAVSEFQWRSRQIMLTFVYRLNQKKPRRPDRNGGMDDNSDAGF